MLEDFEGIENLPESLPETEGITSFQKEYLAELDVEAADWEERSEAQQLVYLSSIDGRMDELGIDESQRSELAHSTFTDELAEAYDDFIFENYCTDNTDSDEFDKRLEAPQDHIQIEQISEVLTNCEELRYENWTSLELPEKESILNTLEEQIAEIEQRPPCPVRLSELEDGLWGGYNPESKDITINSRYAEQSDFGIYREIIDTLVHEGRHAYQDYNVNIAEIHPRHSEVTSWSENVEGGKWGYWGDTSSLLGQRLYEQQSIEIDARNFAADVLDKLNLNA